MFIWNGEIKKESFYAQLKSQNEVIANILFHAFYIISKYLYHDRMKSELCWLAKKNEF